MEFSGFMVSRDVGQGGEISFRKSFVFTRNYSKEPNNRHLPQRHSESLINVLYLLYLQLLLDQVRAQVRRQKSVLKFDKCTLHIQTVALIAVCMPSKMQWSFPALWILYSGLLHTETMWCLLVLQSLQRRKVEP